MLCCVCYGPLGQDHRGCLAEGFRSGFITSIEDWKEKSRLAAEEVEALRASAAQPEPAPAPAAPPQPVAEPAGPLPILETMTVEQLKAELRQRGLRLSGRKADLVSRLQRVRDALEAAREEREFQQRRAEAHERQAAARTAAEAKYPSWTKHPLTAANFPAGEYYIGDLCYVLPDELYHGVWGDKFGYETGYFTDGKNAFAMHHTSWGDGSYEDEEGNKYSVDAGIIGIAPAALLKSRNEPGRFITFTEPVTFRTEGGSRSVTFVVKSGYEEIRIAT